MGEVRLVGLALPPTKAFHWGMAAHAGTLFNASAALGAWALGGPFWGVIAFLSIAILRMGLEAQALRRENDELRYCLAHAATSSSEVAEGNADTDAPPESLTRPSRTALDRTRAV